MTHTKQIERSMNPYTPTESVAVQNTGESRVLIRTHSRIVVLVACAASWIVPLLGMPIGAYMSLLPKGGRDEAIGTIGLICFSVSLFAPICIGYWLYRKIGLKGLLITGVWLPAFYIGFLVFVGLTE